MKVKTYEKLRVKESVLDREDTFFCVLAMIDRAIYSEGMGMWSDRK